mmetsp:Transcript_42228/g.134094  ORF Transcript_42228/g.134094 Transcript_42228/m.134094 type:complete len:281 (-) Transcript_42228:536-1378(-)
MHRRGLVVLRGRLRRRTAALALAAGRLALARWSRSRGLRRAGEHLGTARWLAHGALAAVAAVRHALGGRAHQAAAPVGFVVILLGVEAQWNAGRRPSGRALQGLLVLITGAEGHILLGAAATVVHGELPRAVHFVAIIAVGVVWEVWQENLARRVLREDTVSVALLLVALLLQHAVLAPRHGRPAGGLCAGLAELLRKLGLLPHEALFLCADVRRQLVGTASKNLRNLRLLAALLALLRPQLPAGPLQLSCETSYRPIHLQKAPPHVLHLRAQHVGHRAV